jgi:hypothetical protein
MTRIKQEPDDWQCGFVAGASDGGSSEAPSWISDTAAYAAGFADGQAARALARNWARGVGVAKSGSASGSSAA